MARAALVTAPTRSASKHIAECDAADKAKTVSMTQEELAALLAKARQEGAAQPKPFSMKVSEKGAVSIYGLGRFPVTLYAEQMRRLLDNKAKIEAFMIDNADKLATKE
jgi:hypothetical protein